MVNESFTGPDDEPLGRRMPPDELELADVTWQGEDPVQALDDDGDGILLPADVDHRNELVLHVPVLISVRALGTDIVEGTVAELDVVDRLVLAKDPALTQEVGDALIEMRPRLLEVRTPLHLSHLRHRVDSRRDVLHGRRHRRDSPNDIDVVVVAPGARERQEQDDERRNRALHEFLLMPDAPPARSAPPLCEEANDLNVS